MEVILVSDRTVREIIMYVLAKYDGSGDWWHSWSDNLDVQVYEEDDQMTILVYPYSLPFFSLTDKWQTLARIPLHPAESMLPRYNMKGQTPHHLRKEVVIRRHTR
jgi:hypothetical protein